jgi:hypothetical protein
MQFVAYVIEGAGYFVCGGVVFHRLCNVVGVTYSLGTLLV